MRNEDSLRPTKNALADLLVLKNSNGPRKPPASLQQFVPACCWVLLCSKSREHVVGTEKLVKIDLSYLLKYCRKIIVLEAPDDVLMKRLEDGDNFNDAVETIPRRIKTYRCNQDGTTNSKDAPTSVSSYVLHQLFCQGKRVSCIV